MGLVCAKNASKKFSRLGTFKRLQIRAQATLDSGIGSLELIPGLLKRLQIRAQATLAGSRRLPVLASRGVADSPYQRVGESLSDLQ